MLSTRKTLLGFFGIYMSVACGERIAPVSGLNAAEVAYSGSIRISLAHPAQDGSKDYDLLFAASKTATWLGVCADTPLVQCTRTSPDYIETKVVYETSGKRFFRPEVAGALADNFVMTVIAGGSTNTIIDSRMIEIRAKNPTAGTAQGSASPPSTAVPTAAQIQPVVQKYCGSVGCHPQYTANPSAISPSAAGQVRSGAMPKGMSMPESDKQQLLKFLGG